MVYLQLKQLYIFLSRSTEKQKGKLKSVTITSIHTLIKAKIFEASSFNQNNICQIPKGKIIQGDSFKGTSSKDNYGNRKCWNEILARKWTKNNPEFSI